MPEPTTLAAVGIMALSEGVKFLYKEASEALRVWHSKRTTTSGSGDDSLPIKIPPVFAGNLSQPRFDPDVLDRIAEPLRAARTDLADVADGIEPIDSANSELLARIDSLRTLMEAVLQQRITFHGENRLPSGPMVLGSVDVDQVKAYAAAVRARTVRGGIVTGTARAKEVGEGGTLVGVDITEIGDSGFQDELPTPTGRQITPPVVE